MDAAAGLDADRPIATSAEDLLGRTPIVDQLALWVRGAPTQDGFVIGLTGAWGSGKSSVLHLLAAQLEPDATVVWFEPWLFSEADQLVVRFFDEVAAQLSQSKGKRLKKIGTRMAGYGAALSPAANLVLGPAGQLAAVPQQVAALRERSASARRAELRDALLSHPGRIVVLIDDIDRLDAREVREVLRLVKLVADLPGVVHVLSYARERVEHALEQGGHEDGREFLEKIVQASFALPALSKDQLRTMTLEWLQQAVGERLVAWDSGAWSSLVDGGIDGYLHTLRDGRRLTNMVPAPLALCGDEVASMDVIALEALRVFDPDVHEALLGLATTLTGQREAFDFVGREQRQAAEREEVAAILSRSSHRTATTSLLRQLFPAAGHLFGGSAHTAQQSWLQGKRVANHAVLLRYLHFSLATGEAPSIIVDAAVEALASADELRQLLDDTADAQLNDLLDRIRVRVGEQSEIDAAGCSRVLLEAVPRMSRRPGFFEVEPERRVVWLVEALIEHSRPSSARVEVARAVVSGAPTLSLEIVLLYRLRVPDEGPSNAPSLDLLDADAFSQMRSALVSRVQDMPADDLAREDQLLWLLTDLREVAGAPVVLQRLEQRPILVATLEKQGTNVRPVTDGPPSVNVAPLIELAGPGLLAALAELLEDPGELPGDLVAALRASLADQARGSQNADGDVA